MYVQGVYWGFVPSSLHARLNFKGLWSLNEHGVGALRCAHCLSELAELAELAELERIGPNLAVKARFDPSIGAGDDG